jgi:ornithine cyclodeaminase/alanine dehydrogenase-like protein (mu-crystallin family)
MLAQAPLWITEAEVVSLMDLGGAIEALEGGLFAEARGAAENMVKTHAVWGHGHTLHAIGATFPDAGFVGTKTWAHTEGGATPLLILFDSHNGSLRAVIEAFALGQMRTASASGVATRWLAAPGADEFAIIGTGKQALTQVAAVIAVRPIRRVRVFGRDRERRARFADRVRSELQVEVMEAATVQEALRSAPIITVVTRATEPVIFADMLARGAHVNAVGAIVPERAEIGQDALSRCTCIVADSVPQAQKLSRELMEYFGLPDSPGWQRVRPLCEIVASRRSRASSDDVTLFKALGMGISDLSLGMEIYRKAVERGLGRRLETPGKVPPRLRVSQPTQASQRG